METSNASKAWRWISAGLILASGTGCEPQNSAMLSAAIAMSMSVLLLGALIWNSYQWRRRWKRVAQSKAYLAATLRSIGEGVVVTDDAGAIAMMNPVAEHVTGWTEVE